MRVIALFLFLVPSMLFAQIESKVNIHHNDSVLSVQSRIFSRSASESGIETKQARAQFFPTHVVRMEGNIETHEEMYDATCDEFMDNASYLFKDLYSLNNVSYWMSCSCSMKIGDPKALHFTMWANFDALTDEAINIIQSFIAEKQGTDFYDQSLNIEPVTAVIALVKLNVGNFIPPLDQVVQREFYADNKFYFDSVADMDKEFVEKIWPNFFSTDDDLVKVFLTKWFPDYADDYYLARLFESNYIGLNIEPIFIFKTVPKAVTPFTEYIACSKTKQGICKPLFPASEPQIEYLHKR